MGVDAAPLREEDNITAAALWVGGAILSFCTMGVAARALQTELSTVEIMLYRSIIGFGLVLLVARLRGLAPWRTQRLPLHLGRNVVHFFGQTMWLVGLSYLTFGELVSLEFTSPIWVTLLSPFLLGEAFTRRKGLAILLGFIGVLIIAQPGLRPLNPGHAAGLSCALGFALTSIITKRLSQTEMLWTILFWMTLFQTLFALILTAPGGITLPDLARAPWIVVIGMAGLSAHLCLTSALQRAPASTVAPMEFMRLPAMTLLGIALYGEPFEIWVVIGAAIILGGNLINRPRARSLAR